MSSVRQKVLRTVRLLPETVKIGMESEAALSLAALPLEQGEEQRSNEGEAVPEASIPGERGETEELREQMEDLRRCLDDAERRNADLSRERAELEAETERLRLDYAERERALESRVQGEEKRADKRNIR